MSHKIATSVIAGVTMLGVSAAEAPTQREHISYECAADVRDVQGDRLLVVAGSIGAEVCDATIATNKYWIDNGHANAAETPVVYVGTDEKFYCATGGTVSYNNSNAAQYCFDSDIIVIGHDALSSEIKPGDPANALQAETWFTVTHEYGHAVAIKSGMDKLQGDDLIGIQFEGQADCFAGKVMGAKAPHLTSTERKVLKHYPKNDPKHPRPGQRSKAFSTGVKGGSCAIKHLVKVGAVDTVTHNGK